MRRAPRAGRFRPHRWRALRACGCRASLPTSTTTAATCRSCARSASSAGCQSPSSTRTSTARMPRCCAHATPPMPTGPATTRASGFGASIRDCVLIGACWAQPRRAQYASNVVEGRELEIDDPLRGRHESVETGHDHANGEAVLGRQRLTVHRVGEHRVAPVHDRGDRRSRRPPVDRRALQLVGAGLHAGFLEDVGERYAEPARVADELAADLVRHARERDVALDRATAQEIREVDLELAVDHAVHLQAPRLGGHLRHARRGVDAVEVGVRRDELRYALDRRLHAVRNRARRRTPVPAARRWRGSPTR